MGTVFVVRKRNDYGTGRVRFDSWHVLVKDRGIVMSKPDDCMTIIVRNASRDPECFLIFPAVATATRNHLWGLRESSRPTRQSHSSRANPIVVDSPTVDDTVGQTMRRGAVTRSTPGGGLSLMTFCIPDTVAHRCSSM